MAKYKFRLPGVNPTQLHTDIAKDPRVGNIFEYVRTKGHKVFIHTSEKDSPAIEEALKEIVTAHKPIIEGGK